jgi:hypothetical protein
MLNCNTIFLSDIHLGCKDCQAEYLAALPLQPLLSKKVA